MKRLLLFLSMLLLVGGTTMAFANGANGSDLIRVSNNENGVSTNAVVQPQNNNSSVKPLEATNNEPVITFTTSKKIGEKIKLKDGNGGSLSKSIKIEGATLENAERHRYVLTAQTVKIIGYCASLDCSENGITSIDLSKNRLLENLNCTSNKLEVLDLSNEAQLRTLKCPDNQLTSLVLPQNSKISELNCDWNKLTELDLSKQTELNTLNCNRNALTSLDLTNCENITLLNCRKNKITQIKLPEDAEKLGLIQFGSNNIDVEHMEQLINSLPERTGYRYTTDTSYYKSLLYVQSSSTDGNQITWEQAKKARDKGWTVYDVDKYTIPTGISTIDNADASPRKVFDLNGCEVNENQAKGVVIVKQGNKTYKKVVK